MSHYQVWVTPRAMQEINDLPGYMRQRIKKAIKALAQNPRPAGGKELDWPVAGHELRRLRFDHWRVLYAITEADNAVDVLAVRRRPPYDYGDLAILLRELL